MKREEEINLLCQHLAKVWNAGANRNLEALFEQAVQWADKHTKNPWREGLPTEDGEYLVECGYYKYGEPHFYHKTLYWKHDEWINECLGDFVLRWMPIPSIEGC